MWYEDKDFYLHAFDVLAEENANFASSLSFFKEDLQDLGTEIRLEQQHEADTAYTVVTEDGSANLRKQTRTFERKEYKGKDKQLMRNLLEEIDPTVWESEK